MSHRRDQIYTILSNLGLAALPSNPAASLFEYGLDSLRVVLLATRLEKEFAIKIYDAEFEENSLSSVENIERLISQCESV